MVAIAQIKKGSSASTDNKKKPPSIKLTKPERQFVHHMVRLENRIATCREYIDLWMKFFRFFADDLSQKEITGADEKAFFQIMTLLSRKHFQFIELMGDTFESGDKILDTLILAVSLSNIQIMPENTRSKLELDWHSLFLEMNKGLGRLLRMVSSHQTLLETLEKFSKVSPQDFEQLREAVGTPRKNRTLAAVLAFPPMGLLGLDCFYRGRTGLGVARILTAGGLGVWALIDFIRIVTGKSTLTPNSTASRKRRW